jgi:two-component system, OmpR family, response regulator
MAMNESGATSSNKSKIILAIDDEAENIVLLSKILSSANYTFFGASNGTEALILVERVIPRLILLDVEMPHVDGFAVCRRLRAEQRLRHVPIAFLTARKTTEDVRAGMAAGGNDFITKPFEAEKLLTRVGHWTTRKVG